MAKKLFVLILWLCLLFCGGCVVNPITGEQELMFFPQQQDIKIGAGYAPEVEKQLGGPVKNKTVQNYIDSVGQRIARVSHRPNLDYHYVAVNDKQINAMALPGGYIFITKGMLLKLKSEAELAGILGHETVHVVARDVSNAMSRQIGMELVLSAVASRTGSQGAVMMADLASQMIGLRFSRDDERTADLGGMDYMVRAGYDPGAIVETMQMLEEEQQARPIEFFATHPSPGNRVAYLRQRIQTHYFNSREGLTVGRADYQKYVLDQLGD